MPPIKPSPLQPTVRIAAFGNLNAYPVFEYELDMLARGSGSSNLLGMAYALLPFSGAFVIAIFGTDIPSIHVYNAFVMTALVTGVAGAICLLLGRTDYLSNKRLVAEIKSRMPSAVAPTPPTTPPVVATAGTPQVNAPTQPKPP